MSDIFLTVIAGGSGTRFWPKSTSQRPKQLLSFGKSRPGETRPSLLEQTLERFDSLVSPENQLIVTTQKLSEAISRQKIKAHILAEPQGRNTAPCIYWAAQWIAQKNPNAIMLVMPSDHHILNLDQFKSVIRKAIQWAENHDDLITLGIKPTRPETGYGYLKTTGTGIPLKVESFIEKPNLEKAQAYLKSSHYLWNGGMFVWTVRSILSAFDKWMPEMKDTWNSHGGNPVNAYPHLPAISIDYGIMEKASNVVTFPLDCGWDDLGSWTSLESLAKVLHLQKEGNFLADGDLVSLHSKGNIIDAHGRTVALLGVNDLIIVEAGDALMIASKEKAQDIRQLVEAVKKIRPDLT